MSENIRRVGRELKYKGAILDVYTDHMEFENGNKAAFLVLDNFLCVVAG